MSVSAWPSPVSGIFAGLCCSSRRLAWPWGRCPAIWLHPLPNTPAPPTMGSAHCLPPWLPRLFSCGLALLAQFYPKKYPANFWLLLGCVAAYVVLSTLMTGQPGVGSGRGRALRLDLRQAGSQGCLSRGGAAGQHEKTGNVGTGEEAARLLRSAFGPTISRASFPPAVVASVFEKDAILLTKGGGPKGAPPLAVSSKLPRFGTKYTLSIVPRWAAWGWGSKAGACPVFARAR